MTSRPIGEVFRVASGGTPSRKRSDFYTDGTIPWVKTGDLKGRWVEMPEEKINQLAIESSSAKVFPENTVLLAMYGATIGACSILPFKAATNQACAAILPNDKADMNYVYYFLKSYKDKFINAGVGGAQPNISAAIVKNTKIPLPPLETQQKIASILDAADAYRQKTKALITKYDQLAQSLFLDMFGDPVTNPKGWEKETFRKVVTQISDGPFGSNLKSIHYKDEGIRVVRLNNVGVGHFVDKDKAFVDVNHYEKIKKYTCTKGDVLIATMGTPNVRACKFPEHLDFAIHKADNVKIRPNMQFLLQDFIVAMINSPSILRMAEMDMHGQTRTRVSMGQIAKWKVPIPPIELQKKFALQLETLESQRIVLDRNISKSEDLFNSLLQRAFKGELV